MKRLLAGAVGALLCMGIVGSQPAQADSADSMGRCLVWHKLNDGPPGRWLWIAKAAWPAHHAHGDFVVKCSID